MAISRYELKRYAFQAAALGEAYKPLRDATMDAIVALFNTSWTNEEYSETEYEKGTDDIVDYFNAVVPSVQEDWLWEADVDGTVSRVDQTA